jgi:hypothetical protein
MGNGTESQQSILDRFTNKLFGNVADIYANGGGKMEAKEIVRNDLHALWTIAQQYRDAEVIKMVNGLIEKIENHK